MRIINVMKEPYEFTFDGGQYGPILPGQVVDYPDEVAIHALKRSVVHDEVGDVIGYRMKTLGEVDSEVLKTMAIFTCPMQQVGQCNAKPFKNYADLMKHMEGHEPADKTSRKQ